ncbi:MAG: hypothetical protein HC859_02420 [Bacteroidia bacterium]|nr:hypothetical protein [Bacteroidia bacterium]
MKTQTLAFVCLLAIATACNTKNENLASSVIGNPAEEGFDEANSDPAAIELADSIMAAMGGRENWNNTRFISWEFFGRRKLVWDKWEGRVRIESPADSTIYLVNVNTGEGKVQVKGHELTEADSLGKMLERAKSIWINDSYWLVMPFKLKDTGVTLKYMGEDTISTGMMCNVLQLTFDDVGDTPQNKYMVYVDVKDNLVKQWSYFREAAQDSSNFTRPWDNYKKYGSILLSADRSDKGGPGNVAVANEMPDETFTTF